MLIWLIALVLGPVLTVVHYRMTGASRATLPLALRGVALTMIIALALDAPLGRAGASRPYAALDASASWLVTGDSALWMQAIQRAESVGADSLLLIGDAVRSAAPASLPTDGASRVGPLVERALGAGRAVVLVTDGRLDDPERLTELPGGSRVVLLDGVPRRDAAVVSLDGPSAIVSGDTAEYAVVVAAGGAGGGAGRVDLTLDGALFGTVPLDSLSPFAERELRVRGMVQGAAGARVLRVVLTSAGDALSRNDTLQAVLEVARGASAVFASTSPDEDARYALAVLRGTLAVPTRGYLRVAPGQWRVDGALTPVTEEEVKRALADAPIAILHGDTLLFGPPRALTRGALALLAPPVQHGEDYYAMSAPTSPLGPALGAFPWDSLPPVELGDVGRDFDWVGVMARRARRLDERPMVAGSARPRRVVVVPATGLWRWRFRGGRSADAYTALWGSIFDWLTGDATDARAAHTATAWLRAGEPVRWRRGVGHDSLATVAIRRRGAAKFDTLQLRFAGDDGTAVSPAIAAGVYETKVGGADGLLVVNASAEWLPRRPSVRSGAIGAAPPGDRAPRARAAWWLYALILTAMCVEWMSRRKVGLR